VKTVSDTVVNTFIGLTICVKRFGRDVPFYEKIWWILTHPLAKHRFFLSIFARSASAVTLSEKSSINTNRKSTMCFPVSLRWTLYIVPTPLFWGSKLQTTVFRVKSHFAWTKFATKFFLCENCQWQGCKAFTGLTVLVKMIGGDVPLNVNFASSKPLFGAAAMLSWSLMNTLHRNYGNGLSNY